MTRRRKYGKGRTQQKRVEQLKTSIIKTSNIFLDMIIEYIYLHRIKAQDI